jgi:hypothetical protein
MAVLPVEHAVRDKLCRLVLSAMAEIEGEE